jgi:hypothetical protein
LLSNAPGAPTPEEVVDHVRRGRALPGSLGVGAPQSVRFALERRATGKLRAEIAADPDSPRARLERYVVLRYPPGADLPVIRQALLSDPNVLSVEENRLVDLAVVPNDPLFGTAGSGAPPSQYQWGSFTLHLPEAWDYTKGHAYVGTVDTGIDTTHPEFAPFNASSSYQGGNFRAHLSRDFGYNDDNVDEGQAQLFNNQITAPQRGGHGTHVAGILGATTNNGLGVAGACWGCSLLIGKASTLFQAACPEGTCVYNAAITEGAAAAALTGLVDRGVQVVNMSFRTTRRTCPSPSTGALCNAILYAAGRDVAMVASAGNGGANVGFPAQDPRVLGAGGIIPDGTFWGTCDPATDTTDCPSNFGPDQEVVAPARQVLSTFYRNMPYITPGCTETTAGAGTGPCTGTSMSSPYVAGIAALVRSVNPLLSQDNVQSLLKSTASFGFFHDDQMGFGIANALAAVRGALGTVGGAVLPNRLTPLFSLYSSTAEDSLYTTAPQMATAAEMDGGYQPAGPVVPGYSAFPGASCSGCRVAPGASVYVFSGDRAPYAGAPPLVPLYRLSYRGTNPANGNAANRDVTYTTEANGINLFHSVGYLLDGIEGYIFQRCTPEPGCIPAGAVRLYRLYNTARDDFAIFPESELAQKQADGYESVSGLNDWIGYVYPNVDSDGDGLIDGFETLIGTNPNRAHSDCDGVPDGAEVLGFPARDPLSSSGCGDDFNGDGHDDLVWRHSSAGADAVWYMNGTALLGVASLPSMADPSWHIEAVADFDGDGDADLFWRTYPAGTNTIWLMQGTAFVSAVSLPTVPDANWSVAGAADFTDDGRPDLVWRHKPSGSNAVWVLGAPGVLSTVVALPSLADPAWRIGAVGDFSGDGHPDLVWQNATSGAVMIWGMQGTTYATSYTVQGTASDPWYIAARGDYNGDGRLDLVWRNKTTGEDVQWYLGRPAGSVNGTASFQTVPDSNWQIVGPR